MIIMYDEDKKKMTEEKASLLENLGCTKPWSHNYRLVRNPKFTKINNHSVTKKNEEVTVSDYRATLFDGRRYVINGDEASPGYSFVSLIHDIGTSKILNYLEMGYSNILGQIKIYWDYLFRLPVYPCSNEPRDPNSYSKEYIVNFNAPTYLRLFELKNSERETPPSQKYDQELASLKSKFSSISQSIDSVLTRVRMSDSKISALESKLKTISTDQKAILNAVSKIKVTPRSAPKTRPEAKPKTPAVIPLKLKPVYDIMQSGITKTELIQAALADKKILLGKQAITNQKRRIKELLGQTSPEKGSESGQDDVTRRNETDKNTTNTITEYNESHNKP